VIDLFTLALRTEYSVPFWYWATRPVMMNVMDVMNVINFQPLLCRVPGNW
jgi:hypothetical protein